MSMDKMPEPKSDKYVERVKEIADNFRNKSHDNIAIETLYTYGQNLAGIYEYLERQVSEIRYKRDAWKQRRDEIYNEMYAENRKNCSTIKETENKTDRDMSEIEREVAKVEKEYRDVRAILNSCERMSSMIQTLIKARDSNKYNNFD